MYITGGKRKWRYCDYIGGAAITNMAPIPVVPTAAPPARNISYRHRALFLSYFYRESTSRPACKYRIDADDLLYEFRRVKSK